jgi:hypothetical protein
VAGGVQRHVASIPGALCVEGVRSAPRVVAGLALWLG